MSQITAQDVANYFLGLSDPDVGDILSNLKLQKLVYYAQGYHLAVFGSPLFDDPIKAWEHGPVVPDLYHKYKYFGQEAIHIPHQVDDSMFTIEQMELMDEVYQVLGQFSAWKLRNMTHSEPPWSSTPKDEVITHSKMKEYFATQLLDSDQEN